MADQESQVVDETIREAALQAMKDAGIDESNWPNMEQEDEEDPSIPETEEAEEDESESEPATDDEAGTGEPEEEDESEPLAEDEDETDYFGLDLSDLPPEKRAEVIERFKAQDRYIQSIQRKAADLEKQTQPEPEPEEVDPLAALAELSDDDLLKQLGYDTEDPMYDVQKEAVAPLARLVAQQTIALQQMTAQSQEAEFEQHWTSTLDQLEAAHGKLPISREELVDIALSNNIFDPEDAYARVMISGRSTLQKELDAFKAETKKKLAEKPRKKPVSTVRPSARKADKAGPKPQLDPKEAALQAAKDLGIDWGETLKQLA